MWIEFRRGHPFDIVFFCQNPLFSTPEGMAMPHLSLGILGLLLRFLFGRVEDGAIFRLIFNLVMFEFRGHKFNPIN